MHVAKIANYFRNMEWVNVFCIAIGHSTPPYPCPCPCTPLPCNARLKHPPPLPKVLTKSDLGGPLLWDFCVCGVGYSGVVGQLGAVGKRPYYQAAVRIQ